MAYTDDRGRPEIVADQSLKTSAAVPRIVAGAAGDAADADGADPGGQAPGGAPARRAAAGR